MLSPQVSGVFHTRQHNKPTYEWGPLAELGPEGDLGGAGVTRAFVETLALVEWGGVEVEGDGLVGVAAVLHSVQAEVIWK